MENDAGLRKFVEETIALAEEKVERSGLVVALMAEFRREREAGFREGAEAMAGKVRDHKVNIYGTFAMDEDDLEQDLAELTGKGERHD